MVRRIGWLIVLAGCATAPESHTPALGRYQATMVATAAGLAPTTMVADLVLTYASPDSIVGTVSGVAMASAPFTLGFWNVDAYRVDARTSFTAVAQLRLTFGPSPQCHASLRYSGPRFVNTVSCVLR